MNRLKKISLMTMFFGVFGMRGEVTASGFLDFVRTHPKLSMVGVSILLLGGYHVIKLASVAVVVEANNRLRSDSQTNIDTISDATKVYNDFAVRILEKFDTLLRPVPMKLVLSSRNITAIITSLKPLLSNDQAFKKTLKERQQEVSSILRIIENGDRYKGIEKYPKDIWVWYTTFSNPTTLDKGEPIERFLFWPTIAVENDFIWHWMLDRQKYEKEIDGIVDSKLKSFSHLWKNRGKESHELSTQPYAADIVKIYMKLYLANEFMKYILKNIYDHDVVEPPQQQQ